MQQLPGEGKEAVQGRRGKCGLSQGNRLWLLNYELNWQRAMAAARRQLPPGLACQVASLPLLPVPPLSLLPHPLRHLLGVKNYFSRFFTAFSAFVGFGFNGFLNAN